jgi:hypothetical protein
MLMPIYHVGAIVRLAADPRRKGAVTSVIPGGAEILYQVFMEGKAQTFYESQLISDAVDAKKTKVVSLGEFRLYLTVLHIRHPSCSILYSLNAALIYFIPYQFRPALKFILFIMNSPFFPKNILYFRTVFQFLSFHTPKLPIHPNLDYEAT